MWDFSLNSPLSGNVFCLFCKGQVTFAISQSAMRREYLFRALCMNATNSILQKSEGCPEEEYCDLPTSNLLTKIRLQEHLLAMVIYCLWCSRLYYTENQVGFSIIDRKIMSCSDNKLADDGDNAI